MKQFKFFTIAGIIFVLAAGSLAHFLYDWTGQNYIVGLFTPVNESVWEHMKLLFFPMLFYFLFMIIRFREKCLCITSSFFFGILAGTWLIPIFYYAYTCIIGKHIFVFDIGTFVLSVLIAFVISYRLSISCRLKSYSVLLAGMVCVLFACFVIFTYHPPDSNLFQDPTVTISL